MCDLNLLPVANFRIYNDQYSCECGFYSQRCDEHFPTNLFCWFRKPITFKIHTPPHGNVGKHERDSER